MVGSIYGGPMPSVNDEAHSASLFPSDRAPAATPQPCASVHPGIVVDPDLSPDDQMAVLSHVDAEVVATLGELAALLPRHPRPVGAVLLMVRHGLLAIDTGAPFGPETMVCRAEPRQD